MPTPASRWARTTSATAWRTRASKAAGSGRVPVSSVSRSTVRSSGRGRLPVCVVRMRSVLAFMAPYDSTWVSLDAMATIKEIQTDHYRVPLPVALSDSTHGTIRDFELITARVRDADGAEGVGYTYTVGAGGFAVHALLARDLAPLLMGRDAERLEALWQAMWGGPPYRGRRGAPGLC